MGKYLPLRGTSDTINLIRLHTEIPHAATCYFGRSIELLEAQLDAQGLLATVGLLLSDCLLLSLWWPARARSLAAPTPARRCDRPLCRRRTCSNCRRFARALRFLKVHSYIVSSRPFKRHARTNPLWSLQVPASGREAQRLDRVHECRCSCRQWA